MPGFFPHTGGAASGFVPLSIATFDTLLDKIVTDVGGGVNGWTLHDDQRTLAGHAGGVYAIPTNTGGAATSAYGYNFTNASPTVSATVMGNIYSREHVPGWSEIMHASATPGGTWTQITAITGDNSMTMAGNATSGPTNVKNVQEKAAGYVVLKCTSAQKTFYVQIIRPRSYAYALRVQAWEDWNASTHVGTNGSIQEFLRAFSVRQANGSVGVQMLLWLLPDAFGLWTGGDPGLSNYESDFCYVGNLVPLRTGDTDCTIFACSCQHISGATGKSLGMAGVGPIGGAQVLRTVAGGSWVRPDGQAQVALVVANFGTVVPRGSYFLHDFGRGFVDDGGYVQLVDNEYWQSSPPSATNNEGKRGDLRYLKYPAGFPSGQHLTTVGPAEDGNTYVVVRATLPLLDAGNTNVAGDVNIASTPGVSGFSIAGRGGASGELNSTVTNYAEVPRYFCLPVNL